MSVRIVILSLFFPGVFVGTTAGNFALASDVIRVEAPVWSGVIEDIDPSRAPHMTAALSPDGAAVAYVQGAPWPRVFLRRLGEGDGSETDLMLGPVLPFGSEPPRFSPDAKWVYFTAVDRRVPRRGKASVPVRTHVVRASTSDGTLEFLYPERGASGSASAVLLDVSPVGDRFLVGRSREALVPASSSPAMLGVFELAAQGELSPTPLGFRVEYGARARYSAEGESAEYAGATELEGKPAYLFHDGESTRLERLFASEYALVGRFSVVRQLIPHVGSFGHDGFFDYRVRAVGAPVGTTALLRFDESYRKEGGDLPQPVFFTDDHVLLRSAGDDPRRYLVSRYRRETAEGTTPDLTSARTAMLVLPDAFAAGEFRARAEGETRAILQQVAASLRVDHEARTPSALAATLIEEPFGAGVPAGEGGTERRRLEVVEALPGKLRIERIREMDVEGPVPAGSDDPLPVTRTEVFAFDGTRCWVKTEDDEYHSLPPEAFTIESNGSSLYRLLLDPAGLRDSRIRFARLETVPAAEGEDERLAVSFSYVDGFGGRLILVRRDGLLLPTAIETPLVHSTPMARDQASTARKTKRLGFGGWEEWEGHRIPTTLSFEDGANDRLIGVLGLRELSDVDSSVFDDPSS